MSYGIQVNVGTVNQPRWKWFNGHTMELTRFPSMQKAKDQLDMWFPYPRSECFRVMLIEDTMPCFPEVMA